MRLMISALKAQKMAEGIQKTAEDYAKVLKMRTYDYVDKMLFDMQAKMDDLNLKYFGEMYANLEKSFEDINGVLQGNRDEIKEMAYMTQNGQDGVFVRREDEDE